MRFPKTETRNHLHTFKARLINKFMLRLFYVACLCSISLTVLAQSGGTINAHLNDSGAQVGRLTAGSVTPPAAFSGIERPDTASFLMSVPIVSLPGRGLSVNLNLNYDSSLYQKGTNGNNLYIESTRGDEFSYHDSIKGYPGYGFTLGFGMLIKHNSLILNCTESVVPTTSYCPGGPPPPTPGPGSGTVTFIDNTGARHRIASGISVDASDLRSGADAGQPTITYPDGTKIIFGTSRLNPVDTIRQEWFCPDNGQGRRSCKLYDELFFPTKIVDRNGNYIEISYVNPASTYSYNGGGPRISKIMDTLGREIIFNYDSTYFILTSITVPGFTPDTRREVVRFYYGQNLTRVHDFASQGTYSESGVKILQYVYFPGTKSGLKYSYSTYGMIYKVEKLLGMDVDPTGAITNYGQTAASTEYDYPTTPQHLLFQLPGYTKRTDYWLDASGNTVGPVVHEFHVDYTSELQTSITTITAPDGTISEIRKRYYPVQAHTTNWVDTWDEGLIKEEKVTKDSKVYSKINYNWEKKDGGPRLLDETVTDDAGQQRKTTFTYYNPALVSNVWNGVFTNVDEVKEFGFDGAELRRTKTTYETRLELISRWLVKLPTSVKVYEASSALPASQVDYVYDANPNLTSYNNVPMYQTNTPQYRGNITSTSSNTNAANPDQGQVITEATTYDIVGNIVSRTDPNGNVSTIEYSAGFAYAYPTRVISATPDQSRQEQTEKHGATSPLITTTNYNLYTGLVTSTTDTNARTTSYDYDDPINRLKRVTRPDNGWTSYDYSDALGNLYINTKMALDSSRAVESYTYFDGQGRACRTFSYDGSAPQQTWSVTDMEYDNRGRGQRASNPYFVSTLGENIDPGSIDWTINDYDALGRVVSMTTPDGAQVKSYYDGSRTLVKDQAGKQRLSHANALGQLTDIWEIKSADSATEAVSFPDHPEVVAGYHTSYTYDVMGNLRKVEQGVQHRYFAYDSLSRLVRVRNLEQGINSSLALPSAMVSSLSDGNNSWSMVYEYYPNGNLKKKIDARQVQTDYIYDALNRMIKRSYSVVIGAPVPTNYVATPQAEYFYDGTGMPLENGVRLPTPAYSKGRLTAVKSSVSETINTEFDPMGHVKKHRQVVDPQGSPTSYMMEYGYDLAGNMISQKYPSGRTINTLFDTAGRISQVSGGLGSAENSSSSMLQMDLYADSFTYTAHGAVSSFKLGNGLWERTKYNSRLQPTLLRLGTEQNGSDRLTLSYSYGTTDNNGNVRSQTITVPNINAILGATVTQTYSYDQLNRLQSVAEIGGDNSWTQSYTYADPDGTGGQFGNRRIDAANTTQGLIPASNPTFNKDTNRFDANQGYDYDGAGNLKAAPGFSYSFDSENLMVIANNGQAGGLSTYSYDGDGRRVKKVASTSATTTIFVYNILGQMVAEYATSSLPSSGGTNYLTEDALGTPRIISGADGSVKARHDYLPFGEELPANAALGATARTDKQGYVYGLGNGKDNLNQKFTQKERDIETGLDYFVARYYSSSQGRFTSPDDIMFSRVANPQTWNLYSYTANNPTKRVDPNGQDWYQFGSGPYSTYEWRDSKDKTLKYRDHDGKEQEAQNVGEYILEIVKTGELNSEGAEIVKLYLWKQNKVIKSESAFSAGADKTDGSGTKYKPIPPGSYLIQLWSKGTAQDKDNDGYPDVSYGLEKITNPQWQGSWGTKRARLNWKDKTAPEEYQGIYLHGHRNQNNTTWGCVCDRDERILDAIFNITTEKYMRAVATPSLWDKFFGQFAPNFVHPQ
jgi:RHS repeat-associated protein